MIHRYLALIMGMVFVSNTLMAQTPEEEAVVIPRYDVEIVVFKNNQVPKGKEYILPVSSPLKDETILDLSSADSVTAALEMDYELLPVDELRLIGIVGKIVASPRYDLLLHTAWRQPGVDRAKVLPVWIKGGRIYGNEYTSIDNQIEFQEFAGQQETSPSVEFNEETLEALELEMMEKSQRENPAGLYELEGKITIALSRYLHTYVDLVLRRPRLSIDSASGSSEPTGNTSDYSADTRILNNHSLREHRRMRSKNLHYIDSPEFGMLILITPYQVPEEVEAVPDAVEMTDDAVVDGNT